MIKKNLSSVVDEYINEYYECSKKIKYTELTKDNGLSKALYKDLPNTEMSGYPIASDFLSEIDGNSYSIDEYEKLSSEEKKHMQLQYYYLEKYHELYVGTTGSGKTTGCLEPQLRAITSQKNKPNIFITDPKGEIFERNAQHLKDNGYQLFLLNFKNVHRSDKWNPLHEVYDRQMGKMNIGKGILVREKPIDPKLYLMFPESSYVNDIYVEYDGKAFPDGACVSNYVCGQESDIDCDVEVELAQLANMMVRSEDKKKSTHWELGAKDIVKGVLTCMLEDAIEPNSGFTKDMMSFKTLHEYYSAIRDFCYSSKSESALDRCPLMKGKSRNAKRLLSSSFNTAKVTMQGYCSVFESATQDWFQSQILNITTGNTVNLDNLGDKPFAIFVITRDYEKSDFIIAGLFIDWVYKKMVQKADNHEKTRVTHFLLDEFGNIPEIKSFESKIATARSRNIFFHLFVQSYAQLDAVYDGGVSLIIRDNCNSQIFLGSQNQKTKEIFSSDCGMRTVPSLSSVLVSEDNSVTTVPLVRLSDLDQIKPGKMFIKRINCPVVESQYIRSYICGQQNIFKDFNNYGLDRLAPISNESFNLSKYTYKALIDDGFDF